MMRPSWVCSEGYDYFDSENEYETDQEYHPEDSDQSLKRQRSQDEPSYFDKLTLRKDDDETGPSRKKCPPLDDTITKLVKPLDEPEVLIRDIRARTPKRGMFRFSNELRSL